MSKRFLSHLAHVEMITPKLDQSVRFFKEIMGLYETARERDSVYLRCWGEHYRYSVVLTAGKEPALGHASWRAAGPAELAEAVSRIEASGIQGEWLEQSLGHGRAYRFRGPGGHAHEIFWEVERFVAPPELQSTYPERPQRYFARGISPRQIDHVTLCTRDVVKTCNWYQDILGFRSMAYSVLDHDPSVAVFGLVTSNEKSHDLGFGIDMSKVPGRFHHLAFFVDSQSEHLRSAEMLLEAGMPIEYGPGRHGMGEQSYVYFREPGGLRLEINTSGYRNYVPDWKPVYWRLSQGSNTMYRNIGMPDSMTEAFPHATEPVVPDADLPPAFAGHENPWKKYG